MASKISPRSSTSSRLSGFSRSATAVNPNSAKTTPQIPQQPATNSTTSLSSSFSSVSDDNAPNSPYGPEPVQGWPKLARLMATTPDFAAFPRFRELNVKSLLYYQVQLTVLQKKLHDQEVLDKRPNGGRANQFSERAEFVLRKRPVEIEQPKKDLEPESAQEDLEGEQSYRVSNPERRQESESEQFKIIKEIRDVLKEYNDALLQYSQISALPEPDTYNIRSLRNWIGHEDGGATKIRGEGSNVWGNITVKEDPSLWRQFGILLLTLIWPQQPPTEYLDLVATRPQSKLDGLTQWFAWYLVPFYYACKDKLKKSQNADVENGGGIAAGSPASSPGNERKPKSPAQSDNSLQIKDPKDWVKQTERETTIESVSESSLVRFTSGISTVVACLLPVVAIAVLSQVHGTRDLLLCLAGFSVIFCVGLISMTQGTTTRVEIFSATAAFSAVMVVFMSDPIIVVTPGNPYPAPINVTSPGT